MRALILRSSDDISVSYIGEMLEQTGVTYDFVDNLQTVTRQDVVFVGHCALNNDQIRLLSDTGCTVVGFAVENADEFFGITQKGCLPQKQPYEVNGWFLLNDDLVGIKEKQVKLPVFSDLLKITGKTVLAQVEAGENTLPALAKNDNRYYFAFDLPLTLYKGIQGRTLTGGSEFFPIGRVPDAGILPDDYDYAVAFADAYRLIIEKILYENGFPLIHTLPPVADGTPSDVLFYFGGDDDATSAELDLKASQIMLDRGLPYHINLMPTTKEGGYTLTKEQYDCIRSRGHELALHYDLTGGIAPFSEEGFAVQIQSYLNQYGELPVCNVGHCFVQLGNGEYAAYQSKYGILGDNSRLGILNKANINAFNLYGFGFGTSFPHFVYHEGEKVNFLGIPITYYEPRLGGEYGDSPEKLERCADDAAFYGRCINLFSHPHYIAGYGGYASEMTLNAFDTVLSHCQKKGYSVYLSGVDKLCLWWHKRAKCRISGSDSREFTVTLEDDAPMVIKWPAGAESETVTVDGKETAVFRKTVNGFSYAMVVVKGSGKHTITCFTAE